MKYSSLFKKKAGISLDLGCGNHKQPGFVGMDIQKFPTVEIVHDIEVIPYPIPASICNKILASHMLEHICPKRILRVMNELWRIMKPDGQLLISLPYGGSQGFWQDPTHCHSWNEATMYYFDPYPMSLKGARSTLYDLYRPKPWKVIRCEWFATGSMEIILEKRLTDEKE